MLSALIVVADARVPRPCSPVAVARTLAALMPALVEGVIRDAVLASLASDASASLVAEEAGCGLASVMSPDRVIEAGLAQLKGDALFVLRAGYAPRSGFVEEVADLLARWPVAALMRREPHNLATRFAPGLARAEAVILPRARLVEGARDIDALARGARPCITLRTRLRPLD